MVGSDRNVTIKHLIYYLLSQAVSRFDSRLVTPFVTHPICYYTFSLMRSLDWAGLMTTTVGPLTSQGLRMIPSITKIIRGTCLKYALTIIIIQKFAENGDTNSSIPAASSRNNSQWIKVLNKAKNKDILLEIRLLLCNFSETHNIHKNYTKESPNILEHGAVARTSCRSYRCFRPICPPMRL